MKESEIEDYLVRRVLAVKGEVRKVKWIGRRHCPDRRVMLPGLGGVWVELKRPGATARAGQQREHERMRRLGEEVFVIDSFKGVDILLTAVTMKRPT